LELSKIFDAKSAEERWFQLWIDRGYFKADPRRPGPIFSIVIPPPNVTGALHLGHALNNTLHDVIVRTRRMQGYNTLWLPGTDHAGIATQNVVEREIAKENKTRHDLGREQFVGRVWQWRAAYGGKILDQLRRLGCSCDWSRERFTLDDGLSRAVTKVFVQLYEEGLIERDYRLINWCPRCETALSDLEVDHKDTQGNLWYIRYPLTDGSGAITVATTRPETMLGDTGVAVNPDDQRFRHLVGKMVRLPLVGREIPIIADAAVDREFGTGAVKITPGHDFNDFELGRRHQLAQISIMDKRARMNVAAGPYASMTREACRQRVVADLTAQQLIEKIEPHRHAVGVCSRCDTAVEPMLSYQWFMRVSKPDATGQSMARRAIAAVEQGDTRFYPQHWENTYFAWMRNIQDWCISRQLWWGHRIPAYWCERCTEGQPIVAETRPVSCPRCAGGDLRQDEDVLDTWFSSGLWPFSTLGWPERTPDLERYYPTSLLITAFDIIFFWVARMMMFGLKVNPRAAAHPGDAVPFKHVYITPLVRDAYGRKMGKSRGNVVDPLEIMEKYGTDAVRFTLAQLTVQGRDLLLSDERLAASRAFANKIWNAARFVLLNLEDAPQPLEQIDGSKLGLADRWILDELDAVTAEVTGFVDAYEFNSAALSIYDFAWHRFCDWYLELVKEPLKSGSQGRAVSQYVLVRCLDGLLRLLHPFMPFITEEIWQTLRPYIAEEDLAAHLPIAAFPKMSRSSWLSPAEKEGMKRCIDATQSINSLRSLLHIHPGQIITVFYRGLDLELEGGQMQAWVRYSAILCKAAKFEHLPAGTETGRTIVFQPLGWGEFGIEVPTGSDLEKLRGALEKKHSELQKHLEQTLSRLRSPDFVAKADPDLRQEMADRADNLTKQRDVLGSQLSLLEQAT
jgi:valyl-tRNA synthetase